MGNKWKKYYCKIYKQKVNPKYGAFVGTGDQKVLLWAGMYIDNCWNLGIELMTEWKYTHYAIRLKLFKVEAGISFRFKYYWEFETKERIKDHVKKKNKRFL